MLNLIFRSVFKPLFSALLCINLSVALAATMNITEQDNSSQQLINNQANAFTDFSANLAQPDIDINDAFSTPNSSNTFNELTLSSSSATDNHRTFSEKLLAEYGNNILIQESLESLYEAKQLWDELDSLANDFSYDVLFALKLNKFVEENLTSPNRKKNFQFENVSSKTYDQVNIIQKTKDNLNVNYDSELSQNVLAHLLRIETLYYLIAFVIVISILQKLIVFLLRLFP